MTDPENRSEPGRRRRSVGRRRRDPPRARERSSRRRALKWVIRAGYGAFALAFVPPALALRSLTQKIEG
jgi:hypothetical protein